MAGRAPAQGGSNQLPTGFGRTLVGVCARFVIYALAIAAAILLAAPRTDWFQLATARMAAVLIAAAGIPVRLEGTLLYLRNRTLAVDLACTGALMIALFAALVLAYPLPRKTRLAGLVGGVAALLAVNQARILGAAYVAAAYPRGFGFFHDYLFNVGMVVATVALWIGWLEWARRHA